MVSLTERQLSAARARIAAVAASESVSSILGAVRLREHQCASVARALAVIERDGGCLLADDVGMGKTYVALSVARTWSRPLVVAPASLQSTWSHAMGRAAVGCEMISHELLSRGRMPEGSFDGIIVDESHRFRSTTARRHAVLAELCAHARLLLLSATPLQNRTRDLAAQIALFHGARAFRLEPHALARFVVRSASVGDPDLPAVAPPRYVRPAGDDAEVLREILALPAPTAPIGGGDAGALRTIGLVRAWASSRAALVDMLRRRRQVATAIEQCVAAGLLPTTHELRAWLGADPAIQLGFAPLLASAFVPARVAALQADVEREQQALGRLLRSLARRVDPDHARVGALVGICAAHPDATVLAFTERASTARAYHALLARRPGVGLLTARDARIASGRLSRDDLLSRFAPRARGAPPPPRHERVTLLIATDLLSEGVNLQDASVVVHLDLPWNPARLAQRLGRVRRPGGASVVHSYLIAPPADTEVLLDVEHRLRRKLADAASTIGRGIDVLPALWTVSAESSPRGTALLRGETLARIARWRRPARRDGGSVPVVAAVHSTLSGWLAALDDGRVIARVDSPSLDATASVALATHLCDGRSRPLHDVERDRCLRECQARLDAERLARLCGGEQAPTALSTMVERHVAEALRWAPRHERAMVAAAGSRLRELVRAPLPLGLERALERLLSRRTAPGDISWIREARDLAARVRARAEDERTASIMALIALGPIEPPGPDTSCSQR